MTWSYGDDYEYADSRLSGTIVKHGNSLVYIKSVYNDGSFAGVIIMPDEEDIAGRAQDLDLSPIKLGYSNFTGSPEYIVRIPARKYKQGLSVNNLRQGSGGDRPIDSYLQLLDSHENNYPPLATCLEEGGAWCRTWAVVGKRLFHKGKLVGKALKAGFKLAPEHEHLQEDLDESCPQLV